MHVNSKQKKAGVATHVKEKIDVKSRIVSIEKEHLRILIKESLQQEDIKIIYAYSIRAHKGIKQILEKKKKNWLHKMAIRNFYYPLIKMDRESVNKHALKTL